MYVRGFVASSPNNFIAPSISLLLKDKNPPGSLTCNSFLVDGKVALIENTRPVTPNWLKPAPSQPDGSHNPTAPTFAFNRETSPLASIASSALVFP